MDTKRVVADFEDWREAVAEAVALLENGGLVALPTETVYGLAADAFDAEAVAKVFEVKERPSFDPLIVHIGHKRDLDIVANIPEELDEIVDELVSTYWPGPLTLVLPKKEDVPELVTSGLETVAVRMSAHEVMRAVAKEIPVAAPSANRFGRISPTSADAVMEELGGKIPMVIDGGACRDGLESTIVAPEMSEKGPVLRLLRPGPISREDLRKIAKVIKPKKTKADHIEAPGQVESHYAPTTPLVVIDKPSDFVPEEGVKYGLLSYRGEGNSSLMEATDWAHVEIMSPGKGKLAEGAVRLFYCLRKLDAAGVDVIISESVSETGIGVAMMDRLRRAAAGSKQ
ncbi:L-threonylcarbamoyladenylate synthase [Akkermansiaceae bacterium]|nr:L-threonylcarbamoyladenylate synthase [Akkermansiaceae bacterium]MDA7523224.1 L-threonylcarbamoyladenylate synthase [bacterium]MDA7496753.1 L-threonylcarbamoyladenylate synthase [Akkermansiaceae bacterium]MDA7500719.1 L-threonylcarbamoyladenylate synthase [Akkermansiaceae bacterium]MDA7515026.1 L-threonylcarbamoyladenylate synthase [Akkermansiaceae bacterium]